MKIIKEKKTGEKYSRIVIRVDSYAHTIAHVMKLRAIAQQDFPNVTDDDIDIKVYNDPLYGRTMGIEFGVPTNSAIPAEYREVRELMFVYN